MRTILSSVGLTLILATPSLALAAAAPKNLQDLAGWVVNLIDQGIVLLIAAAVVLFFYGTSVRIFQAKEGKGGELRSYLVWGVVILFVMVSIWGILHILQDTLFGGSAMQNTNPSPSYYTL